jgi:hypothetical protein
MMKASMMTSMQACTPSRYCGKLQHRHMHIQAHLHDQHNGAVSKSPGQSLRPSITANIRQRRNCFVFANTPAELNIRMAAACHPNT